MDSTYLKATFSLDNSIAYDEEGQWAGFDGRTINLLLVQGFGASRKNQSED